ncbi:hypothetical protein [Oceanobacillus sp. J11TS1]|uniref:hypothetical protein n=1 Tax=Oceanobacillus sp. J11TS1 TaxID=2807191 RepID=UPI001B130F76|nr:hypothetical protein [Oceanobacillus sp. J11TS1]GIO24699.1 hypothetical protein J11TS1_32800 [Oceanobacillus sp. J11TS1]
MKKLMLLLVAILLAGVLVACGDSDSGSEAKTDTDTNQESNEDTLETEDEDAEVYEFNQEIADNDNFKATLVSIERVIDEDWDEEKIEVTFEVENKRDDTVEFQAREVSINDKMVDESLQSMSTEVAGGKSADAVLTIEDYEGGNLPELEGDFEMLLNVFSWDDMDYDEEAEVNVTFE